MALLLSCTIVRVHPTCYFYTNSLQGSIAGAGAVTLFLRSSTVCRKITCIHSSLNSAHTTHTLHSHRRPMFNTVPHLQIPNYQVDTTWLSEYKTRLCVGNVSTSYLYERHNYVELCPLFGGSFINCIIII